MKHILLGFIAVLSLMLVPLILMHKGKEAVSRISLNR